jgi:DNA-binding transcriptional regulator YdaS (Cro superfamily)
MTGKQRLLEAIGGPIRGRSARLADLLKISRAAVSSWKHIPIKRLIEIEQLFGVPREQLRPDLFDRNYTPTPPASDSSPHVGG